jgi:hypothetical protein
MKSVAEFVLPIRSSALTSGLPQTRRCVALFETPAHFDDATVGNGKASNAPSSRSFQNLTWLA